MLVKDLRVPVRRVHLLPIAGGQHGQVDGPEFSGYAQGGGRDRSGIGDVEGYDEHVPSRNLPEPFVPASRDRDGGSTAGEFPGDCCADTT